MPRIQFLRRYGPLVSLKLASLYLCACTADISVPETSGAPPMGGSGVTGSGGGSTAGNGVSSTGEVSSGTTGGMVGVGCEGTDMAASKRIVRLSFNQIANTIGTLIDPSLTEQLATDNAILDSKHRAFPPLQSPREGNSVTDVQWATIDAMASAAARHVFDNFATITNCGAAPTDACAQEYLFTLAAKAYRRPLTADEQTRLTTLYTTTLRGEAGATINEAVQHGVYAILQAPQVVYRTELGGDWTVDGMLSQYEIASALSYFLTDDSPDQQLLDAAAQNQLSTPEQIAVQVDRLLQTDAARQNLQDAMISYFNYQALEGLVIQDPLFTDGVAASMYHEGELFLQNALWTGSLNELLLGRKSVVNASLAEIYGISPFPQAGATPDADGFAMVDLPPNRTGLVTMPGFLTTRSRPTETSVVGRGLLVKNAFLCTETPPPTDDILEIINQLEEEQMDQTERQKATYRQTTPPCSNCHASFDAYGLALDKYDLIGRYREMDPEGRPIDASVTLPPEVGGSSAADIVEVAQKIAETGVFAKCMGRNLINYALADVSAGSASIISCSAQRVAEAFAATDQSFSSLVKSVATSVPFTSRSKGAAQ